MMKFLLLMMSIFALSFGQILFLDEDKPTVEKIFDALVNENQQYFDRLIQYYTQCNCSCAVQFNNLQCLLGQMEKYDLKNLVNDPPQINFTQEQKSLNTQLNKINEVSDLYRLALNAALQSVLKVPEDFSDEGDKQTFFLHFQGSSYLSDPKYPLHVQFEQIKMVSKEIDFSKSEIEYLKKENDDLEISLHLQDFEDQDELKIEEQRIKEQIKSNLFSISAHEENIPHNEQLLQQYLSVFKSKLVQISFRIQTLLNIEVNKGIKVKDKLQKSIQQSKKAIKIEKKDYANLLKKIIYNSFICLTRNIQQNDFLKVDISGQHHEEIYIRLSRKQFNSFVPQSPSVIQFINFYRPVSLVLKSEGIHNRNWEKQNGKSEKQEFCCVEQDNIKERALEGKIESIVGNKMIVVQQRFGRINIDLTFCSRIYKVLTGGGKFDTIVFSVQSFNFELFERNTNINLVLRRGIMFQKVLVQPQNSQNDNNNSTGKSAAQIFALTFSVPQ